MKMEDLNARIVIKPAVLQVFLEDMNRNHAKVQGLTKKMGKWLSMRRKI